MTDHLRDPSGAILRLPTPDRVLELVLVLVLCTGSIGLIAALAGVFEAPQIWVLGLAITAIYQRRTRDSPMHWRYPAKWKHVALLVLVALFFRVPVFHYILGGQDEGVYVNIANHILRTGGVGVSDPIAAKFLGTPMLDQYLASNRSGGSFLAGIYARNGSVVGLEFQFYHLFPVWMALVGGLFGLSASVYALTLFSLLSILFAYRLVLALTGSYAASLWGSLLLSVNPLHAFFSKFPLTEVPTLAFSMAGFCCLAEYWLGAPDRRNGRMMWIAFGAISSIFFVRISGFMYVPFLVALACLVALRDVDAVRRVVIQRWVLAVLAVYIISVFYGLHWSRHYALDIYSLSFGAALGANWRILLFVGCVLASLFWLSCLIVHRRTAWSDRVRAYLVTPARRLIALLVLGALAVVFIRIYWLGWTSHYSGDPWLAAQWHLSGSHWRALKATSFAQLNVYLGPPLLFLALVLLCCRRKEPEIEYARLLAAGFCVYSLVLPWIVPYGPYYARYLLSETLPYIVIYTACVWSAFSGRLRVVTGIILGLSVLYGAVLSAAQIGKQENDGIYSTFSAIVSHVGSRDVILLNDMDDDLPDTNQFETPLIYTFGKNVITMSDQDLSDQAYLAAIGERFDDVFLISPSASAPRGFSELDTFRVEMWAYKWGYGPPHALVRRADARLHLFRRDRPQVPLGVSVLFNQKSEWSSWLRDGWSSPESWGVWAIGKHARIEVDAGELPPGPDGVVLHFVFRPFLTRAHPTQRLSMAVDGRAEQAIEASFPATTAAFDLPVSAQSIRDQDRISLDLTLPDAVSPQALGLSGDSREISFGLVSVEARQLKVPSR